MTKHIVQLPNPDGSLLLRELNHRGKNELTSAMCRVSAKAVLSDEAICAGNEGALKRVRDQAGNGMAVIASVRALEQLDSPQAAVNVNIEIKAGYVIDLSERCAAPQSVERTPAGMI